MKTNYNPKKLIAAILPTYDKHGNNSCQIIYNTGKEEILPISVAHFLKKWLFSFKVDITSQRMWGRDIVHNRHLNPLVISESIILIPVRTREVFGTKDGCYGYIWTGSIQSYTPETIALKCGVTISYLSSMKKLKEKLVSAKLLHYTYKDQRMIQQRIFNQYRENENQWNTEPYEDTSETKDESEDKDKDNGLEQAHQEPDKKKLTINLIVSFFLSFRFITSQTEFSMPLGPESFAQYFCTS